MVAYLIIFIAGLGVSIVLTPLLRSRLLRHGVVDKPDVRKVHTKDIPRLGGLAIYAGFCVAMATAYFRYPSLFEEKEIQMLGLLVASTFIVAIGAIDDVVNIRPWIKLACQVAAAVILMLFNYNIEAIANPFGGNIELGFWSYPFTIVWVIGVINAINLVDGLDGLASGVGLIIAMTIFLISIYFGKAYAALLSIGLTGALVGFLRHNFYPAKIFMGDSGSMFIGLVIAALGLVSSQKAAISFAIVVPIITLGYPIVDTALAIVRRAKARRSIFVADREHIHHLLMSYGYSHQKTVIVLYIICLFFGIMALLYAFYSHYSNFILGVLFFVTLFIVLFVRILAAIRSTTRSSESEVEEKQDA